MKMTTGGTEPNLAAKRHFFFDVDGTLARSHTPVEPSMRELLQALRRSGRTVTVVTGSDLHYIKQSIPCLWSEADCDFSALAQSGNMAYDAQGSVVWERPLREEQKREILGYVARVRAAERFDVPDEGDLVQDRGSQVSFSIYGHNAPVGEKETVDPDMSKRKALLQKYPFVSQDVDVRIGGTTTFDFFAKGFNKGRNIADFIALPRFGWKEEECVYLGDRLEPGGNDETVVGVIDTKAVRDPADCERVVRGVLES